MEQVSVDEAKNEGGLIIIRHPFVEPNHPRFANFLAKMDVGYTPDIKEFMTINRIREAQVEYCDEPTAKELSDKLLR